MSFIRVQKLRRDKDGIVTQGTASIMKTVYDRERKHGSRQTVIEKLGKVVFFDSATPRKGVFFSQTRGLVEYDADTGAFTEVSPGDPRARHFARPRMAVHFEFGTADLFLNFMKNSGMTGLLKGVFSEKGDFARVMAHFYHTVMRAGQKVGRDDFVARSLLSRTLSGPARDSLRGDTRFFEMMGREEVKGRYFRAYVDMMRGMDPRFGSSRIVDSTPLPNDASRNPFSAPSSHGQGGVVNQSRLALVLDRRTSLPVWFSVIPGNVIDVNTLDRIRRDLSCFTGVAVEDYTLDAGYCSRALIEALFPRELPADPGADVIVRMPARRGYGYNTLYSRKKGSFDNPNKMFVLGDHTYFGDREEVSLFGRKAYAYIYLDKERALAGYRKFSMEHPEELKAMKRKDHEYKMYSAGLFVALSTVKNDCLPMPRAYRRRAGIEAVFKTAKSRIGLVPLSKWSAATTAGKLLSDIICTTIYVKFRDAANAAGLSMSSLIGALGSSICTVDTEDKIYVDYPSVKVKNIWKAFGRDQVTGVRTGEYFRRLGL